MGGSRIASTSDESLRAALAASAYFISPSILACALVWTVIDRPAAPFVVASLGVCGVLMGGLQLRWRRHPPAKPNRAVSFMIGLLYLCATAQLLGNPDPALGALHLIIAIGAMVFLIDLRWLIAVQLFGAGCWLFVVALSPPSPQWLLQAYVISVGLVAAYTFRLARLHSMRRMKELRDESLDNELQSQADREALEASQRHLVEAQRIAHMGSYQWDLATQTLTWSDGHYRLFGWDLGEEPITLQSFYDAVHPMDRDALVEAVAASLHHEGPVDLAYRVRVRGEEFFIHGRGETHFDDAGRAIQFAGTSIDVTRQKRTERALRATEERLRAVLTALDADRVVGVEQDGTINSILGEPGQTGRYGIRGAEIPGRRIEDFLPGSAGTEMAARVRQVYATGEPQDSEAQVDFPRGSFHFDVSLRAVRYNGDDVSSVLAVVRDVTQRKRAEQALQQSQKLESLGLLAGGIAHDFNNLLVGILTNSETALMTVPEDAPARAPLEDILLASEHAAEMTGELMAFAGESKSAEKELFLPAVVDAIAHLARGAAPQDISIDVAHDSERAWVRGDLAQLQRVVMNFIANATEAIGSAAGRVSIRTGILDADEAFLGQCYSADAVDPGEFAFLKVGDDGPGIGAETIDRIFDPFFTTKLQGRGLGLASTLGIVRRHGGAIRVDSVIGVGTSFWALLPLTSPAVVEADADSSVLERSEGRGSVLVVDDDDIVRAAAIRALDAIGYESVGASSGADAIAIVESDPERFRAALVDITMPGLDGAQTAAALREIQPGLPVLFMSGHAADEVARRSEDGGATRRIHKPFRLSELADGLRDLLET